MKVKDRCGSVKKNECGVNCKCKMKIDEKDKIISVLFTKITDLQNKLRRFETMIKYSKSVDLRQNDLTESIEFPKSSKKKRINVSSWFLNTDSNHSRDYDKNLNSSHSHYRNKSTLMTSQFLTKNSQKEKEKPFINNRSKDNKGKKFSLNLNGSNFSILKPFIPTDSTTPRMPTDKNKDNFTKNRLTYSFDYKQNKIPYFLTNPIESKEIINENSYKESFYRNDLILNEVNENISSGDFSFNNDDTSPDMDIKFQLKLIKARTQAIMNKLSDANIKLIRRVNSISNLNMSKLSNFNFLLFEDNFNQNYENLKGDIIISSKNSARIENLLISITNDKIEKAIIRDILNLISRIISDNLTLEEFDEVSLKYLNKLNELFKDLMNRLKVSLNQKEIFQSILLNIESLNFSFANFLKKFNESYQTYNDKHKNLMKIIPNSLKVYFKLWEENFEILSVNRKETLKSFLINIISLINNFPLLIRPYENRLETILKNILTKIALSSDPDKELIKVVCLSFNLLIRLSPDINTKLNSFIKRILANFEFYLNLFLPKTIKIVKSIVNESEIKNFESNLNFFNFKENSSKQKILKNPSLQFAFKVIVILTKLSKYIFKSIPKNHSSEINFSEIFNFVINTIKSHPASPHNFQKDDLVLEGLKIADYKILKEIILNQNLKIFIFLVQNYSEYFYYFIPSIRSTFSLILIKFDDFTKLFDNYVEIFKVFTSLIKLFDTNLNSIIDDFIFKICINNTIDILAAFTERNDKTVVKIDQNYFKLKTVKTHNQKNKQTISLIQMAKKETFNESLEKYSNEEMEVLFNSYLEIFVTYFQSDCHLYLLNNEDNKNLIKSLVDVLILPSYAKFIFSIPISVKRNLIKIVYSYLKYSDYLMNIQQIERFNTFLRAFNSNDEIEKNYMIIVNEMINRRINLNSRHLNLNELNEITRVTIDLNKKIADKLRVNADFVLNKIEFERENVPNSLLNKKRKHEEIEELKEEKKQNNLQNNSREHNESYKIELSLREVDEEQNEIENINYIDIMKIKDTNLILKKSQNIATNDSTKDGLIKSKWALKDQNKNEFVSTDKIVMILKDKKTFIEETNRIVEIEPDVDDKNIPGLNQKQEVINENKKSNTESDSESDSDSQIEIPDIF